MEKKKLLCDLHSLTQVTKRISGVDKKEAGWKDMWWCGDAFVVVIFKSGGVYLVHTAQSHAKKSLMWEL